MGTKNKDMNTINDRFEHILDFAREYGLPMSKKRAVIREYLQVKILDSLYRKKIFKNIYFIGGTSLRLLRGIDRFSEDLDFDIPINTQSEVIDGMTALADELRNENISVELYKNITAKKSYFELRFTRLLYTLELSSHKEEKLAIKFDYESFWKGHDQEVVLLNRYGFLVHVVTINKNQLLTQKIFTYINRKQTMPRDMYDIVWLYSQGAKPDFEFMKKNSISQDMISQAQTKLCQEEKKLTQYEIKLQPFLIHEKYVDKIRMLSEILQKL